MKRTHLSEWKTVEGFKELEEGRLTYYDRAAGTEHWDKVYLRDLWIAPNGTAFALLRFQKPSMERNLIVPTGCGKCRSLVVRLRLQ